MKAKKGVKILGAVLGAAAISMTVICCYAPGDYIGYEPEYNSDRTADDYIEQTAKENSLMNVTFNDENENKETE